MCGLSSSGGAQLRFTPSTSFDLITTCLSWLLCLIVAMAFLGISNECWHWFVIPTFLCGVLMAHDAVNWCRGRLDPYDPVGLLGMFGIHFFFLAPFLHVIWEWWVITPDMP